MGHMGMKKVDCCEESLKAARKLQNVVYYPLQTERFPILNIIVVSLFYADGSRINFLFYYCNLAFLPFHVLIVSRCW